MNILTIESFGPTRVLRSLPLSARRINPIVFQNIGIGDHATANGGQHMDVSNLVGIDLQGIPVHHDKTHKLAGFQEAGASRLGLSSNRNRFARSGLAFPGTFEPLSSIWFSTRPSPAVGHRLPIRHPTIQNYEAQFCGRPRRGKPEPKNQSTQSCNKPLRLNRQPHCCLFPKSIPPLSLCISDVKLQPNPIHAFSVQV